MGFSKKDYLKYSWLNLSWDFVIEMNVYIPSTNPWTSRVLFQLDNYQVILSSDWKIKFANGNWNKLYTSFNYNTYSWFQKFIAIKQGKNYTLKIWNTTIWTFNNSNTISSSANLYIWSSSIKNKQLNSVIDYVKIYKNN